MSPLPFSRDQNAAAGFAIPANLGNNLQDMIVGGRHGEKILMFPAIAGEASIGTWTRNGFFVNATAGGSAFDLALDLPRLSRILAVDIYYRRVGGTLTFDLLKVALSGTPFTEGTTVMATDNAGTIDTKITFTPGTPITIALDEHCYVRLTNGANLDRFYAIGVHIDK